jgi:hypothetical protein
MRCTDLSVSIAGRSLREWYDRLLSYDYDGIYTEGEAVRLWAYNESLDDAISRLSELDEWEAWRELREEEKDVLKECFKKVISDVWRYSWEVVRAVLSDKPLCEDWRQGKFSREAVEESMLRITRIGLSRNMGEQAAVKDLVKKMIEEGDEEWKEWLAGKVWLNLVEEILE